MVSDTVLRQAVDRLAERFRPSRIILFGSQARGTADERSDVDLVVVCPIEGSRRRLMVDMDRALAGLGFARDVIAITPEEYERDQRIPGTVARYAAREGKVIYERA